MASSASRLDTRLPAQEELDTWEKKKKEILIRNHVRSFLIQPEVKGRLKKDGDCYV